MGPEILFSWQALVTLVVFVLLSLWVISTVASQRFQSIGWLGVFFGYTCALGALVFVLFLQLHLESANLLMHSVLGGYLVLPWVTFLVLPMLLWQPRPTLALSVLAVAAVLLVGVLGMILQPRTEGFDRSLVTKNYLSDLLDLLVTLISSALAFYIGSRARRHATSNDA